MIELTGDAANTAWEAAWSDAWDTALADAWNTNAASNTAREAAWDVAKAAWDARDAGAAAGDEVNSKILDYGLKLLEEQND